LAQAFGSSYRARTWRNAARLGEPRTIRLKVCVATFQWACSNKSGAYASNDVAGEPEVSQFALLFGLP